MRNRIPTTRKLIAGRGRVTSLLAALIMAVCFASVADAADWRIRIKNAVCVEGDRVMLSDIAVPVGEVPAPVLKQMASTELWKPSQRRGRPVFVPREKMQSILQHYVPKLMSRIVVPGTVAIQTGGKVYSRNDLQALIVDFLTNKMATQGGELKFRQFTVPEYMFLANTTDSLRIIPPSTIKPGRVQIRFDAMGPDNKAVKRVSAGVFMDLWKTVPCATMPLNRGDVLTPENITWIRKNVAYNENVWDGKGINLRISQPVGTGQPITYSNIELIPLVMRGEQVYLTYKGKNLRLTIKVEALRDAGLGQQVLVRNLQSKRTIVATVTGDNTVEVR